MIKYESPGSACQEVWCCPTLLLWSGDSPQPDVWSLQIGAWTAELVTGFGGRAHPLPRHVSEGGIMLFLAWVNPWADSTWYFVYSCEVSVYRPAPYFWTITDPINQLFGQYPVNILDCYSRLLQNRCGRLPWCWLPLQNRSVVTSTAIWNGSKCWSSWDLVLVLLKNSSIISNLWIYIHMYAIKYIMFCAQLCPTLCDPVDCTGVGCHLPPGDLPDPGNEPVSLTFSWFGRWVLYH